MSCKTFTCVNDAVYSPTFGTMYCQACIRDNISTHHNDYLKSRSLNNNECQKKFCDNKTKESIFCVECLVELKDIYLENDIIRATKQVNDKLRRENKLLILQTRTN